MPRGENVLTLRTVGPLRVIGADGTDRTPAGRKAKGLLALLALAPEHRRGRAWVQDKLWSDRGPEQGAASLRQTLSEIRRAFGAASDCLKSDRSTIALDRLRVAVSARQEQAEGDVGRQVDRSILLEGLDISDPEFEDWLRDQRQAFDTAQAETPRAPTAPAPTTETQSPPPQVRLQLVLEPTRPDLPQTTMTANYLTDIVAKTISEIGAIDVLDLRNGGEPSTPLRASPGFTRSISLQAGVAHDKDGTTWRLVLSKTLEKQILWSTGAHRPVAGLDVGDPELLRDLNQIVDAALAGFLSWPAAGQEQRIAAVLCQQGIQQLFKLGAENMLLADDLFSRAFDIEPRGIYLAWRAYLRTFQLVEFLPSDRKTVADEAVVLARRAFELDPLNSFVSSFYAQVHSIARRSYVAAYEFAQRSIQLNRANPMGWACLGIAECHLGKVESGFKHTLIASEIAGATPLKFQIDGLACIAASMAGEIDRSIWLGEASHALAPTFKPPLRFLSALYLVRGQEEESQDVLQKLRLIEPGFTYDLLRDKGYPAASLQRAHILERIPARGV